MKILHKQKNKGFTLIETMIAVFILVIAMQGMLGLIASSLFSARYAKNDITANYLIEEAVDYIRNNRDTIAFQQNDPTTNNGWSNFLNNYGYPNSRCFSTPNGCKMDITPDNMSSQPITICDGSNHGFGTIGCEVFNYDENGGNNFYTYLNPSGSVKSNFKRQIVMFMNNADELNIKVTVEWLNGNLVRSRTSEVSLLNWNK
jgi:prepilin-type N-terminal cleavage/methylation domain-containing protein